MRWKICFRGSIRRLDAQESLNLLIPAMVSVLKKGGSRNFNHNSWVSFGVTSEPVPRATSS